MVHPLVALLLESQRNNAASDAASHNASDARKIGVLDLRRTALLSSADLALTRYIPGALRIPAGLAGLDDRFSWLPPPTRKPNKGKSLETRPQSNATDASSETTSARRPTCELIVLCDAEECEGIIHALDRWDIAGTVSSTDSTSFWEDAGQANLTSAISDIQPDLLFEPSPIVKTLVSVWHEQRGNAGGTILDLGCGAGRDLAWIVRYGQQSHTAWRGTALDNLPSTIRRVKLLAAEFDLQSKDTNTSAIETAIIAETTSAGTIEIVDPTKGRHVSSATGARQPAAHQLRHFAAEHLPYRTYDVLLLVRFWPKALLRNLHVLTHSGSMIVLSHFTSVDMDRDDDLLGAESFKTDFMPAPNKRFERKDLDELIDAWQSATGVEWSVIHHALSGSEDGRPLRHVIIQRDAG